MGQSSFKQERNAMVVQGIENHLALTPVSGQSGVFKIAQVVGGCRNCGTGNVGHVANAELFAGQGKDDLKSGFIPQGLKKGG